MAHVAPKSESNYKTLPAGVYPARCYGIAQLGTQEEEFDKKIKRLFKIVLFFEFPTQKEVFKEGKGEEPYTLTKEFTFSMYESAGLRLFIEKWAGKKMTAEQAEGYDVGKMLGKICQISVVEYNKRAGGTGSKIDAVMPLMAGTIVDPQINKTIDFSLTDETLDTATFDTLPKWVQDKAKLSPEYQKLIGNEPEPEFKGYAGPNQPAPVESEDLPF